MKCAFIAYHRPILQRGFPRIRKNKCDVFDVVWRLWCRPTCCLWRRTWACIRRIRVPTHDSFSYSQVVASKGTLAAISFFDFNPYRRDNSFCALFKFEFVCANHEFKIIIYVLCIQASYDSPSSLLGGTRKAKVKGIRREWTFPLSCCKILWSIYNKQFISIGQTKYLFSELSRRNTQYLSTLEPKALV